MKLSIVATLYSSASYINEFYKRAFDAAEKLVGNDFEIILVNDGSPDSSLDVALKLAEVEDKLKIIDLSRNFGHHKAMMTGLSHAKGERVFLIDTDLEEEPEWLLSFAKQFDEENCDVVFGVQKSRKGRLFERWSGVGFYRMFRAFTGLALPENIVTARLMSRRYVEALLSHEEREVFLAGLWHITGFTQKPQLIDKKCSSETTYTLRRKLSLLVNSITSFSNLPLVGIFYVGLAISVFSGMYTCYICINWLFFAIPPSGWTSIIVSIWLLSGMIISFIGVVGIYIAKIFSETKRRPYTIIRAIYDKTIR